MKSDPIRVDNVQLRPKNAAKRMGISLATFYKIVKDDPEFPALTRIGLRCTSVSEQELDIYLAKKTNVLTSTTKSPTKSRSVSCGEKGIYIKKINLLKLKKLSSQLNDLIKELEN